MALAIGLLAPSPSHALPPKGTRLTVAASGDFLIHSPVWRRALAYGGGRRYEFGPMLRKIAPVIAGADLALCHLETPLSRGSPRGYPSFRTPAALGDAVRAAGWDACSTASNHTLDGGQRGVDTTLDLLERIGLPQTGSYRTEEEARRTTILEAKGVKVAFLAYTALTNGQRAPHPWTLNMARAPLILRDAKRARLAGADAVVVNLHWGDEFRAAPTREQRSLADTLTHS